MKNHRISFAVTIGAALMLTGCQTVQPAKPYTAQQVAVFQQYGFAEEGSNWELGIQDKFLFQTDQAVLAPPQRDRLAEMARTLNGVGIGGAEIGGHADSTGERAYNRALSQRRAEEVRSALQEGGMAGDRLRAIGYGEQRPVESNATAQGRAENRRVVILVTPADAIPVR